MDAELLNKTLALLEDVRWALESTRKKYVIGEDCAKLEELEAGLSALISEGMRACNAGEGE